jgi:hypothetical protein
MEKAEDKKKNKKPRFHGTFVKVTDDNAEEVAKEIVEMFRKVQRSKGH